MVTELSDEEAVEPEQRSVLALTADEAERFFLKHESYCRIDLPPYFCFDDLLSNVSAVLDGEGLNGPWRGSPRDLEDVNHPIFDNKDGRYAWRPLQLIHPALYVSLIRSITETRHWTEICQRFEEFSRTESIVCLSLPVESLTEETDTAAQVSYWWHEIEQRSIRLALDYEYMARADITDCYGAIYTHSIAWAIHSKPVAKERRRDSGLVGNVVDGLMQDMHHGQTNGIPQGSVLMDFVAEMVLGYADTQLADRIRQDQVEDYVILRYRDDYRIFVNNPQDGERILKCLTEVLIGLGLKLNASKTLASGLVINESIKPDKLAWMSRRQWDEDLQKHLLLIHGHAREFPNSGSLEVALVDFHRRMMQFAPVPHPLSLISIVVDIACRNPRTYPVCCAILSELLCFLEEDDEKRSVVQKIVTRFSKIPNTGHMEIWLQRISHAFAPDLGFQEPLCQLVQGVDTPIWNSEWISSDDLRDALNPAVIYDSDVADEMDPVIPTEEVGLFLIRNRSYL